jgi:hypothetical protein
VFSRSSRETADAREPTPSLREQVDIAAHITHVPSEILPHSSRLRVDVRRELSQGRALGDDEQGNVGGINSLNALDANEEPFLADFVTSQ